MYEKLCFIQLRNEIDKGQTNWARRQKSYLRNERGSKKGSQGPLQKMFIQMKNDIDKGQNKWSRRLGWSENPVSSQTDKLMAGIKFSDYLGLKIIKKQKNEMLQTFRLGLLASKF